MDVDRKAPRLGGLGHPPKGRLADGVDRVRGQRRLDQLGGLPDLLQAALGRLAELRLAGRVPDIDQRGADRRPNPGVLDGTRDRPRSPVHVPKPHRPAAHHLYAGEPRSPVHVLVVDARFDRPDHPLEPLHEGHVVAVASEQRHRRVRVPVDQARHEGHPRRIDGLVPRPLLDSRAELGDPPSLDSQAHGLPVEAGADDRQAHARAGTTRCSPWTIACRFAARPASSSSIVNSASPTPFARLSTTQIAA